MTQRLSVTESSILDAKLKVLLERVLNADARPGDYTLLAEIVRFIRPRMTGNAPAAVVHHLEQYFRKEHAHREKFRHHIAALLGSTKQIRFYSEGGLLANRGFVEECWTRCVHNILPPLRNPLFLLDGLHFIFDFDRDAKWILKVPATAWTELFAVVTPAFVSVLEYARVVEEILTSLETLAYRVAALGSETEILDLNPQLNHHASAFLNQATELSVYTTSYRQAMVEGAMVAIDDQQVRVLLNQCLEVIRSILKHASHTGINMGLTHDLERGKQLIHRCVLLLDLIDPSLEGSRTKIENCVRLFLESVEGERDKTSIRAYIKQTSQLVSQEVISHAGRTGEHYITSTRSEFRSLFVAAIGAGFIVGIMSHIKLAAATLHAPALIEGLMFSANYAVGFVLVHLMHFTIATKQPAMTAARIAAVIDESDLLRGDHQALVELFVRLIRSQWIAIFGNVLLSLPTAFGIAWLWQLSFGHAVASPAKVDHLMHDLHPFQSLALLHAAIAGLWLFIAGVSSGFFSNLAVFSQLAPRLNQSKGLKSILGEVRLSKWSKYIENHCGNLMGNIILGCLLGSTATLGQITGLPLDIRHVTFSAANFGIALASSTHPIPWKSLMVCAGGIIAIGCINLFVSFMLSFHLALRAKKRRWRDVVSVRKAFFRRLRQRPLDVLFPPSKPDATT